MVVVDSHRPGDKVRLKTDTGRSTGARGTIDVIEGNGTLVVRIKDDDELLRVRPSGVTNFSLAARKAWRSMPDRPVGRPRGSKVCDRVSVTFRLDRELWESFRVAEEQGRIPDRTSAINDWIRMKLLELLEATEKAS
jgi:hypothetical protein